MAIQAGSYTADQITSFGLSNDETSQVQFKDGVGYKLSDNNSGGRMLEVVGGGNVPLSYQPGSSPNNGAQIQPYLDNYNKALMKEQEAASSIFQSPEQIKQEFDTFVTDPSGEKVVAPNLVDLYGKLRSDGKLQELEDSLGGIKEQEGLIQAALQESTMKEEGKAVAQNIIEGRISENYRRAQIELQFLGTRKARMVDEINGRYNVINTIINLTGQDYQNARAQYDDAFTKNLEVYKLIRGSQEKKFEVAREDTQRAEDKLYDREKMLLANEREDVQRAEDAARSNLQIYANLIKTGNLDSGGLSSDAQLQIGKLEVQSGLGIGFISSLKQDNPEGEVKSITTRQDANGMKYADIIITNPDGSIKVESKPLGMERLPESASGSTKVNEQATIERIIADYTDIKGQIGKTMRKSIAPEDLIRKIRSEFTTGAQYLRDKEITADYLRENMN